MSQPLITRPLIASRTPQAFEVRAGEQYLWCACGRSQHPPLCDGSHAGSGMQPLPYRAERDGWVWFCGCKRSARPPLCDGAHKALPTA